MSTVSDVSEKIAKNEGLHAYTHLATIAAPFIIAAFGYFIVDYLNDIKKISAETQHDRIQIARDLGTINEKMARIDGAIGVLSGRVESTTLQLNGRIDELSRTFNSRLDMQSQWLQGQNQDIDELKRRVYPITPPVASNGQPEQKARNKWTP